MRVKNVKREVTKKQKKMLTLYICDVEFYLCYVLSMCCISCMMNVLNSVRFQTVLFSNTDQMYVLLIKKLKQFML